MGRVLAGIADDVDQGRRRREIDAPVPDRFDAVEVRGGLEDVERIGDAHRGRSDNAIDRHRLPLDILADQFGPAPPAGVDRAVEITLDLHVPTRFRMAQDGQSLQDRSPRYPLVKGPCAANSWRWK